MSVKGVGIMEESIWKILTNITYQWYATSPIILGSIIFGIFRVNNENIPTILVFNPDLFNKRKKKKLTKYFFNFLDSSFELLQLIMD